MPREQPNENYSLAVERLIWAHVEVNFALPIYALLYVFYQGAELGMSEQALGMTLFFILIIVLNGFFQLIARDYMKQTPHQILWSLLVPLVYMGLAGLIWRVSPEWYLFELGVLHGFSLVLAYVGVVFVRPVVTLALFRMPRNDLLWYLFASGMQLLLLLPAMLAAFGFGELIYVVYAAETESAATSIGVTADASGRFLMNGAAIRLGWFGLTLLQLAIHEYAWLRQAAPAV